MILYKTKTKEKKKKNIQLVMDNLIKFKYECKSHDEATRLRQYARWIHADHDIELLKYILKTHDFTLSFKHIREHGSEMGGLYSSQTYTEAITAYKDAEK